MILTMQQLTKMNLDKLYELLLPLISELYKQYNFLGISKNKFHLLLKKEILKVLEQNKKNNNSTIDMKIVFENRLLKYIKNECDVLKLVEQYMKYNMNNNVDKNPVSSLLQIFNFLNKYHIELSLDNIMELIETNSVFTTILKDVVKNKKHIPNEVLHSNNWLMLCIEVYCDLCEDINTDDKQILDGFFEADRMLSNERLYFLDINKIKRLTLEEEIELIKKCKNGDMQARDRLILANQGLIIKYTKMYMYCGLDFLDLIGEGNLGFMNALDKYDLSKNVKLSTYATYDIMAHMGRAIANKSRTIRLPVYFYTELCSYKKVFKELEECLNRAPTVEEIAKRMNISVKKASILQQKQYDAMSLSAPVVSEEENMTLGDFVRDDSLSIEDTVVISNLSVEVSSLLNECGLSEREKAVIIYRYGLNGEEPKTLEEIGQMYNVVRERIRQNEQAALTKLRRSNNILPFLSYMDKPDECLSSIKRYRKDFYKRFDK